MKKRLVSLLLVMWMIVGMLPVSAFAAEATEQFYVAGQAVDMTLDADGTGWSWVAATKTLTLNGFRYEGMITGNTQEAVFKAMGVAYMGGETLKLSLSGENTITSEYAAIMCMGDLIIQDNTDGSLTVEGAIAGIMGGGDLTIESGSINATGGMSGVYIQNGDMTMEGGTLKAKAVGMDAPEPCYGLYVGGVYVDGDGNTDNGLETWVSGGQLFVKDGTLIAEGGEDIVPAYVESFAAGEGVKILAPVGGKLDNGHFVDADGQSVTKVVIGKEKTIDWTTCDMGIYVNDELVEFVDMPIYDGFIGPEDTVEIKVFTEDDEDVTAYAPFTVAWQAVTLSGTDAGTLLHSGTAYTVSAEDFEDGSDHLLLVISDGTQSDFFAFPYAENPGVPDPVYVGGVELSDGQYLAEGAIEATDEQPDGGYAYYADGVLTLSDYDYAGAGRQCDTRYTAAVSSKSHLKIKLEGKNSLTCTAADEELNSCGIYVPMMKNIVISGEGTLEIAADYGIYAGGTITIEGGSLDMTVTEKGIEACDDVSIQDSTVTISAGSSGIYAVGSLTIEYSNLTVSKSAVSAICADENITVKDSVIKTTNKEYGSITSDNGDVIIESGEIEIHSGYDGIVAYYGNVIINGGTVKITAGEDVEDYYADGICAAYGNVTINGGTIEITAAGDGIYEDYGNVTISGGKVTINAAGDGISAGDVYFYGGDTKITAGYAIYGDVTIASDSGLAAYGEDGNEITGYSSSYVHIKEKVAGSIYVGGVELAAGQYLAVGATEATAMQPTSGGYAHYADGVLKLDNYTYSGEGHPYNTSETAAVYAEAGLKVVLAGVNSLVNEAYGNGIYAYGNITVSGEGTLNIAADYGIYTSGGNVTIEGGELTINAEEYGIWAYDGNVTIEDGELTINAVEYGIHVSDGNVTIEKGTTKITVSGEASTGISAYNYEDSNGNVIIEGGTIEITALNDESYGIYAYGEIDISDGKIKIASSYDSISTSDEGDITISGGTIEITSGYDGIYAYNGDITIKGSTIEITAHNGINAPRGKVTIKGRDTNIIADAVNLGINANEAITIAAPLNAYDEDGYPLEEIGSSIDGYVYISKVAPPVAYPLWIGDEQFADEKLTIEDGTGGTATYDPTKNTLTLNNFDLTYSKDEDVPVLQIGMAYAPASLEEEEEESTVLTLVLKGENALRSEKSYAVISVGYDYELVIDGDGSLTITAGEDVYDSAISVIGNLMINGGSVEIASDSTSIWCCDLTVTGGSLKATSAKNSTLQCYDLTVTGGTVEAISKSEDAISCDSLTVTGGSLKAEAGEGYMAICAWLDEIAVGEGLTVIGGQTGSYDFTWEDDEGETQTETSYTILSDGTPATSVEICAAEPVAKIGKTPYYALDEAVDAAEDGNTIVLLQDIELSDSIYINKALTLDLNDHNINNSTSDAIFVQDGGDLTIKDSVGGGTISSGWYGVQVYGGTATISGGTITGGEGIVVSGGEVTITGGNISGTGSDGSGVWIVSGTVNINGGSVTGSVYGVYAQGGTTNINGGTVTANNADGVGAWLSGGTVNINGGTVSGDGQFGYGVCVDIGTTTISGDANISGSYAGVYVSIEGDDKATISGGTISGGTYGVYVESGQCEITGGTITGTGDSGVFIEGGAVNITGGTITGNHGVYASNGSTVLIEGGTIEGGDSGYGVYARAGGIISITGGTITGAVGVESTDYDTLTITGGTFSHDPSDYVDEGYAAKLNSAGMYVVSQIATADVSIAAVDAATGANVLGARLQIIESDGDIRNGWMSNGVNTIEDLPEGTYTLRVSITPDGYIIPADTSFTIDEHGNITYTGTVDENGVLLVKLSKTSVSVTAVDLNGGKKLANATLQVLDKDGNVQEEWTSSNRTAKNITGLKTNEEYTLRATIAPDGYKVPADTRFLIDEEGKVTHTGSMSEDGVLLVEFVQTKVRIAATDIDDGAELAGATLQIIESDGNVVDEWTSAKDSSHVTEGLKTGVEYKLKATIAPDGYTIPTATTFTIDENGKVTHTGSMSEDGVLLVEFTKTSVSVIANDLDDGEQLEGATLQILDKDGNVVDEWTSAKDSSHVTEGLKTGVEYKLKATIAPEGYVLPTEVYFTISESGKVTSTGFSENGVLLVEFTKTTVSIEAVDLNGGNSLMGATLQILDKDGKDVTKWVSAGDVETIRGLKTNEEYTLKATVAPEGYTIPTDTTFTIDESGKVTTTGSMSEDGVLLVELTKTSVSVTANDLDDGSRLAGATLQILDGSGRVVDEWTSAAEEIHTVEGLKTNEEYTLKATIAPDGYTIPTDTTFTIDENGKVTTTGSMSEDGVLLVEFTAEKFDVKFVDHDGTELSKQTVEHGSAAVAPAAPTREGYTFTGWDKAFDNITSALTVTAQYEINKYTVQFVDHDGTELSKQTVEHGSAAVAPAAPTREGGYTFTGWDKAFDNITSALTVTAQYEANKYDVEIQQPTGGNVATDNETPVKGDDVTITVTPDEGKEIDKVIVKDEAGNEIPVTKNEDGSYTYEQPAGDVTVDVTMKDSEYEVEIPTVEGGKIETDNETPVKGDDVTITVTPDEGKEIDKVIVKDENGKEIPVTQNPDGSYTYEQPAGDVTVEVVIKDATPSTPPTPPAPPVEDEEDDDDDYEQPTYRPSIEETEGGETSVNKKNPEKGDKVTITTSPDEGYVVDNVIVLDKNGNEVEVINNGNGTFTFKQPAGKVTIEVVYAMEEKASDFDDVAVEDYFFDAVNWAVENGITNGVGVTTFAPNATCTRAQVVTFLWRAAGSPEPKTTEMPFADIPADAYYYNAVLWAFENGITSGTSAATFGPESTVTRSQTVTFLWRAESGDELDGEHSFADVAADVYYRDAVLWAVENGITNGTSTNTFSPNSGCTRGQIVTFLYRTMAE